MKAVILGDGYLGKAIAAYSPDSKLIVSSYLRHTLVGWDDVKELGRLTYGFDVLINALGKTNVSWCEKSENWHDVRYANSTFPEMLSDLCTSVQCKLVHLSSGVLYDSPLFSTESSTLIARSKYALSKWAGELNVDESRHLILRTASVFDSTEHKQNWLWRTLQYPTLSDGEVSICHISTLVQAIEALIAAEQVGVVNVANSGLVSPATVGELLGWDKTTITVDLLRTLNRYPVSSRMNIGKRSNFFIPPNIELLLESSWDGLK